MRNDIFQRISIPKPCHEDWTKMTPDEKGAFCMVCNKSVHDFSNKTAEEVERILLVEVPGKVCGRFSLKQIQVNQDIHIPYHLLPRNISPFKAFLLAVFLVFGTALFGLKDLFGQNIAGKICLRPARQDTAESAALHPGSKGEVKYVPTESVAPVSNSSVLGGVRISTTSPVVTTLPPVTVINTNEMLLGDVAFIPKNQRQSLDTVSALLIQPETNPVGTVSMRKLDAIVDSEYETPSVSTVSSPDSVLNGSVADPALTLPAAILLPVSGLLSEYILGDTVVQTSPEIVDTPVVDHPEYFVAGEMIVVPSADTEKIPLTVYTEYPPRQSNSPTLEDTSSITPPQALRVPEPKDNPIVLTCFPNPSSGIMTLRYELLSAADVQAAVFDLRGNLILTVFQIPGHHTGVYNQQIDLSQFPNGAYLVRLMIGNVVSSTRIILQR